MGRGNSYSVYSVLFYIRTIFLICLRSCQDGGTLDLFFHWKIMPSIKPLILIQFFLIWFFEFLFEWLSTTCSRFPPYVTTRLSSIHSLNVNSYIMLGMWKTMFTVLILQCNFILFYKVMMFHLKWLFIKNLDRKW